MQKAAVRSKDLHVYMCPAFVSVAAQMCSEWRVHLATSPMARARPLRVSSGATLAQSRSFSTLLLRKPLSAPRNPLLCWGNAAAPGGGVHSQSACLSLSLDRAIEVTEEHILGTKKHPLPRQFKPQSTTTSSHLLLVLRAHPHLCQTHHP